MQFDIGQRSLLDLLDTENELFQARRAYTNAVRDLEIAHARVAASMGQLVTSLSLVSRGSGMLPELLSDTETEAILNRCQVEAPIHYAINQEAIERRIAELKRESAANASVLNAAPVIKIQPVQPVAPSWTSPPAASPTVSHD